MVGGSEEAHRCRRTNRQPRRYFKATRSAVEKHVGNGKQPFFDKARELKEEHGRLHPGYKYQPKRKPRKAPSEPAAAAQSVQPNRRRGQDSRQQQQPGPERPQQTPVERRVVVIRRPSQLPPPVIPSLPIQPLSAILRTVSSTPTKDRIQKGTTRLDSRSGWSTPKKDQLRKSDQETYCLQCVGNLL